MSTLHITAGDNTTIEKQGENLVISSTDTVTEVKNEYSDSTTDTYSCNYVNNLIVTEDVSVTNIVVESKATTYKTFTIPSKAGYTPIAITINSTGGGGSGYANFTVTLEGYLAVYNGWVNNGTFSVSLKITYLKN